jgi:hypothetical protein
MTTRPDDDPLDEDRRRGIRPVLAPSARESVR